jgi:hypothetical protein
MIQVALQLLAIALAMGVVVAYGFIRDKQEHSHHHDDQQQSIYFPEHQAGKEDERVHRGAAMSRL